MTVPVSPSQSLGQFLARPAFLALAIAPSRQGLAPGVLVTGLPGGSASEVGARELPEQLPGELLVELPGCRNSGIPEQAPAGPSAPQPPGGRGAIFFYTNSRPRVAAGGGAEGEEFVAQMAELGLGDEAGAAAAAATEPDLAGVRRRRRRGRTGHAPEGSEAGANVPLAESGLQPQGAVAVRSSAVPSRGSAWAAGLVAAAVATAAAAAAQPQPTGTIGALRTTPLAETLPGDSVAGAVAPPWQPPGATAPGGLRAAEARPAAAWVVAGAPTAATRGVLPSGGAPSGSPAGVSQPAFPQPNPHVVSRQMSLQEAELVVSQAEGLLAGPSGVAAPAIESYGWLIDELICPITQVRNGSVRGKCGL